MTKHIYCPIEVLTDHTLTDSERKILLTLYSFRNNNTELCCPSIQTISKRSGINCLSRIGKLTSSLANKGWLTKKKSGFYGNKTYLVHVPNHLSDTIWEESAYKEKSASRSGNNLPKRIGKNLPNLHNNYINNKYNKKNKSIKKRSITETLNDRSWAIND